MKTITVIAAVGAALIASAAQAKTYDFTFVGSTYDIANGTFTTSNTANSDGTYNILSASGTTTASDLSDPQGAFTLIPGNGASLTSPDGEENYSNLYTPGSDIFDGQGIGLQGASFTSTIYNGVASGYTPCTSDCLSVYNAGGTLFNPGDEGVLTISAVPEMATWAMMLIGFGGLGATMRSQRKKLGGAVAIA